MALELPLRGGDELHLGPNGTGGWELVRGLDRLGQLMVSPDDGSRVTTFGDRRVWSVSGSVVPTEMTLWDEDSGDGAAWCRGRTLHRTVTVQIAGAGQDLTFHPGVVGGARLTGDDGPVATMTSKHRDEKFELTMTLAERPDVASFAGGLVLVAAWRTFASMLPGGGDIGAAGP